MGTGTAWVEKAFKEGPRALNETPGLSPKTCGNCSFPALVDGPYAQAKHTSLLRRSFSHTTLPICQKIVFFL